MVGTSHQTSNRTSMGSCCLLAATIENKVTLLHNLDLDNATSISRVMRAIRRKLRKGKAWDARFSPEKQPLFPSPPKGQRIMRYWEARAARKCVRLITKNILIRHLVQRFVDAEICFPVEIIKAAHWLQDMATLDVLYARKRPYQLAMKRWYKRGFERYPDLRTSRGRSPREYEYEPPLSVRIFSFTFFKSLKLDAEYTDRALGL